MADCRQVSETQPTGKQYLVVGPSWVGDMVMAQTLFTHIKQREPDSSISVLAPDWSRPILERMPEVTNALSLPFGHGALQLGDRRTLGKQLKGQFDHAILLPNSLKSALVPWWADVPIRTGWRGEMRYGLLNDVRLLDKAKLPLMVQRFVALGQPANTPVPERDAITPPKLVANKTTANEACNRLQLATDKPILGLCPGAEFGPAKRWPDSHYAQVARHWIEQGGRVWIFGSAKDADVATLIQTALPTAQQADIALLAGRTSLAEAVDLLSCAQAVVSNDSGLMHIAAALRKPLVAVYGSTSPAFTPPLSANSVCVHLDLWCRPCFQRECPLGHNNCLVKLPPTKVISALDRLLAEES